MTAKRAATTSPKSPAKKIKPEDEGGYIEGLEVPDSTEGTPLAKLYHAMSSASKQKPGKPSKDGVVVYWMR